MSEKERINSLIREAEIYRKQGLLEQSKEIYLKILEIIKNHSVYSKDEKLIGAIKRKIQLVDSEQVEIDESPEQPELSQEMQDLVRRLFAFSKSNDMAAIEGAMALVQFGQYDRALIELEMLMEKGIMPLLMAKNILKCHLTFSSPDKAINQFLQWVEDDSLPKHALQYLRSFLENTLEKQGAKVDLPYVAYEPSEGIRAKGKEDLLDISSVSIKMEKSPGQGVMVDFDVTFHSGNIISMIIPAEKKALIDTFEPQSRLQEIQCYFSLGVYKASGIVSGKKRITSGPRRGDYSLEITIDSV